MTNKTRIVIGGVMVMLAVSAIADEARVITLPSGTLATNYLPLVTGIKVVHGDTYVVTDQPWQVVKVAPAGVTNIVNTVADSGEFCRVRGHIWHAVFNTYAVYRPNEGQTRKCAVCGLQQSQTVSDWK